MPSLLSLGNNYSGPGPNYNNQQSYQQGRYNDRPARQNMKNQRPQPYNKVCLKVNQTTVISVKSPMGETLIHKLRYMVITNQILQHVRCLTYTWKIKVRLQLSEIRPSSFTLFLQREYSHSKTLHEIYLFFD